MKINFYSKKSTLIRSVTDEDAHFIRVTPDDPDYLVIIKASNLSNVSFIEVMDGNTFISRHFIRFGKLVPIYSIEPDRTKCQLIRKQIIADKPTLSISKMFWHKGDKYNVNIKDFLLPLPKSTTLKSKQTI